MFGEILIYMFVFIRVITQPIYLESKTICSYGQCSQPLQFSENTNNIYKYGSTQFGDLSNKNFVLSMWIKLGGISNEKYFIWSLKDSSTHVLTKDATKFYVNDQQIAFATQFPTSSWLQVCFENKWSASINQQSIALINWETPHYQTIKQLNSLITITSAFTVEVLQDSTQQNLGYNQEACCIVMHVNQVCASTIEEYNQMLNIMTNGKPETVLHLKFLEKTQSKITKDWSDYQYIPKLGNSSAIQIDVDDPPIDTSTSSLKFYSNRFIRVDHFDLPKSFTIEIIFSNYINTRIITLLKLFNGATDVMKVDFVPNTKSLRFYWLDIGFPITLTEQQPIYRICLSVLDLKLPNQLSFMINQYIDGEYVDQGHRQLPWYNSAKYIQTLFIGDPQNILSQGGGYFEIYEIKFNQGFYILTTPTIPNCRIYMINRCISCLNDYILDSNYNCVISCPTLQRFEITHNSCVNQCHTICQTCDINNPTTCLTCSGNRINPPECTCPPLYFDDDVSPDCIKYVVDQSVQSGIFTYMCVGNAEWQNVDVTFQSPYLVNPKITFAVVGVRVPAYMEPSFEAYIVSQSTLGFTCCFFCKPDQPRIVMWLSEQGNNLISAVQGGFGSSTTNWVSTIQPTAGQTLLSGIIGCRKQLYNSGNQFSIYQTKSSSSFNVYISLPFYYFKYQNMILRNWQSNYVFNYTLPQMYQNSNLPTSGMYYSVAIDQPKSIDYLLILQGITINKEQVEFMEYEFNRSITSLTIQIITFQNTIISQISVELVFASMKCSNTTGPCNFYSELLSTCNNLNHNLCVCDTIGYYSNINGYCEICDDNCYQCFQSSTQCTSCKPILLQSLVGNTCKCLVNQFTDQYGICVTCLYPCATCQSLYSCDTCLLESNTFIENQQCKCQIGFYEDYGICFRCNPNCLSCSIQPDNCITCPINSILENGICLDCQEVCIGCVEQFNYCICIDPIKKPVSGICRCPDSSYQDPIGNCIDCIGNCLTCADRNDNCITCIEQNTIVIDGVCKCIDRYYNTGLLLLKCQSCDSNCQRCVEQSTKCIDCRESMYLQNYQCFSCHQSCQECTNSKQTDCISCGLNKILLTGSCICRPGYYQDVNYQCEICHYSCLECNSADSCTKCDNSNFRLNLIINTPYCICKQGYYDQSNSKSCLKCKDVCLGCNGIYDFCTACDSSLKRQLDASTGSCNCIPNYFDNGVLQCMSCNSSEGINHKQCQVPYCSDGLIDPDEQCDDGNTIIRDGCTNCKIDTNYQCMNTKPPSICYLCQANCSACTLINSIIVCKICDTGYYLTNNNCIICNVKCITCIMESNNCTTCREDAIPTKEGQCPVCQDKVGYDYINGICQSKCGDGIRANDEECDDGNNITGDGCDSNCIVELTHTCTSDGCEVLPTPSFELNYVNSTTTNSLILNHLTTTEFLINSISITIDLFQPTEFNYTLNSTIIEGGVQSSLDFEYFRTIEPKNLIHIIISYHKNQTRLLEKIEEIIVTPRKQIYTSEEQLDQAKSAQQAQDTFQFLMYFLGPVTILLGGFPFYWAILEIISWVNNLYYINVYFPENVRLIFEKSGWGDINLMPVFIEFNAPTDPYYTESPARFMEKQVDPIFINNTWMCLTIYVATFVAYIVSMTFVKLVNKLRRKTQEICKVNIDIDMQIEQQKSKKSKMPWLIQKPYEQAIWYNNNIKSTILKALNLSFLDLVLAVTLQLYICSTDKIEYGIMMVNFCLSFMGVLLIIGMIIISYQISQKHNILLMNKYYQTRYGIIYENINTKSRVAMLYSFINLLRKALFIVCEVVFYYHPLIQTSTCTFISFLNVALMIYENPFINRKQLIQQGIPDFCIFGVMVSCIVLAVDDRNGSFNSHQRFIIGWVILGNIALSVVVQLYFMLEESIKRVINTYRSMCKRTIKND